MKLARNLLIEKVSVKSRLRTQSAARARVVDIAPFLPLLLSPLAILLVEQFHLLIFIFIPARLHRPIGPQPPSTMMLDISRQRHRSTLIPPDLTLVERASAVAGMRMRVGSWRGAEWWVGSQDGEIGVRIVEVVGVW